MGIVKHYPEDDSTKDKIQSDDSFICPHCDKEQDEHPDDTFNDKMDECGDIECDGCGKTFSAQITTLITYWSFK